MGRGRKHGRVGGSRDDDLDRLLRPRRLVRDDLAGEPDEFRPVEDFPAGIAMERAETLGIICEILAASRGIKQCEGLDCLHVS